LLRSAPLLLALAWPKGAYAAQIVLAAARSGTSPGEFPLRETLGEFMRAAGLVRRIGVNLNQAVAKLNATGSHQPRRVDALADPQPVPMPYERG
jgi:hypothetical protein